MWVNPGSERNKDWNGCYIDVIVGNSADPDKAMVIEVETDESVSDSEAREQWKDYDATFQTRWRLAVPVKSKDRADQLIKKHGIAHCTTITWEPNSDGTYTFQGLPGL